MKRIRLLARVALTVALLLVASCAPLSSGAHATPSARGSPANNATSAAVNRTACAPGSQNEPLSPYFAPKMVSATTGWAVGQCGLPSRPSQPVQCYWPDAEFSGTLRTTDGGHTWTDVSPPSIPNRAFQRAAFFLDATHAWVGEVAASPNACVSGVTTFSTSDGGATWRQGGTVQLQPESPTSSGVFDVPGPTDGMNFIDPQHGWMLVTASSANPQAGAQIIDPTSLYATADGGSHWKLVSVNPGQSALGGTSGCPSSFYAPASDAVFTSATSGWLAIACAPSVAVLRTSDGGATWALKPQCSCQVWQPQYLDSTHAIITNLQGGPVLAATADGGSTWVQRPVPHAASTYFSFVDPNDGWMVGIEQLPNKYDTAVYRTTDGAQSWTLVGKPGFATSTPNPNLYYPIVGLQFVDSNTGFVVLGPESGAQGQAQTEPGTPQLQILTTVDAGRSWSVVLKQIPAAACPSDYTQIGFGNGGLSPAMMASPSTGWAKGGLRTTDGGLHWRDVSAPNLREGSPTRLFPPGYSEFFFDADHAWQVGVYASKTSCEDHATVFFTSDGGKTWQGSSPVPLDLKPTDRIAQVQLGFTSLQSGWLWVPRGQRTSGDFMSFMPSQADLYSTSDGGASWNRISTVGSAQLSGIPPASGSQGCSPFPAQVEFSSASVGWLKVGCTDGVILVTRDGGVIWKVANFAIPSSAGCPCYVAMPQFFDQTHAVVTVMPNDVLPGSGVLLSTSDAGLTWHPVAAPGSGYLLLLSSVGPNDLFALVTPPGWSKVSPGPMELYRSGDGAQSWTKVSSTVPATWPPGFMQFVDVNNGFESNVNGADQLLVTADGGKTWKAITPSIQGSA